MYLTTSFIFDFADVVRPADAAEFFDARPQLAGRLRGEAVTVAAELEDWLAAGFETNASGRLKADPERCVEVFERYLACGLTYGELYVVISPANAKASLREYAQKIDAEKAAAEAKEQALREELDRKFGSGCGTPEQIRQWQEGLLSLEDAVRICDPLPSGIEGKAWKIEGEPAHGVCDDHPEGSVQARQKKLTLTEGEYRILTDFRNALPEATFTPVVYLQHCLKCDYSGRIATIEAKLGAFETCYRLQRGLQ